MAFAKVIITITIVHSNEQTFSFHVADDKTGEQLKSKTRTSEPVNNHPELPSKYIAMHKKKN